MSARYLVTMSCFLPVRGKLWPEVGAVYWSDMDCSPFGWILGAFPCLTSCRNLRGDGGADPALPCGNQIEQIPCQGRWNSKTTKIAACGYFGGFAIRRLAYIQD